MSLEFTRRFLERLGVARKADPLAERPHIFQPGVLRHRRIERADVFEDARHVRVGEIWHRVAVACDAVREYIVEKEAVDAVDVRPICEVFTRSISAALQAEYRD